MKLSNPAIFSSRALAALAGLVLALCSAPGSAITITVTDPTPTYSAIEIPCPPHEECGSIAHLSTTPISFSSNLYFDDAWDAWNATNAAGSEWTKVDGGALDATLNIEIFDAQSFHTNHGVGGLEIQIDFVYTGADRDDFVWAQGLTVNYVPGAFGIVPAYDAMDTSTLSGLTCDAAAVKSVFGADNPDIWCPPLYPYQHTNEKFYDNPLAPYDTGFFEADALLTKVDYANRKLTVYEGVHYGFFLYAVPEPATGALLLVAIMLVASRRFAPGAIRRN